MKKIFWVFIFLLVLPGAQLFAQEQRICGYILDNETLEPLIGASVSIYGTNKGAASDKNGFFCLFIDTVKEQTLQVSYIGYTSQEHPVHFEKNQILQIKLTRGIDIDDITVKAQKSIHDDVIDIPVKQIKSIPNLTGEPDVLKALQMFPGVQSGAEGTSDLYVRGGEKDENLFLLDEVPLYFVNHLGGFMSVFDVNIIKSVDLYKGVIPARYGGRLSSAIDVRLKDGNAATRKSEFMLGTLASKIYSEGPLGKGEKTKYLISLRRCNIDLLSRPLSVMTSGGNDIFAYTFYDLTGKITHTFNEKNKLTAYSYWGRDKLYNRFKMDYDNTTIEKDKILWGNKVLGVKYNHLMDNSLFFESQIYINRFFYTISSDIRTNNSDNTTKSSSVMRSSINDYAYKIQIKWIGKSLKIYTGTACILHHFKPTISESQNDGEETTNDELRIQNCILEWNAYTDAIWKISSRLNAQSGLLYMYWPHINSSAIDPKIKLTYKIRENIFINAGYSYNHQFIHLLSGSSTGILNAELWIPASKDLPEKTAEQFSAGLTWDLNKFDITLDAYKKNWNNLITFNSEQSIEDASNWDELADGKGIGNMKGLEFLFRKNEGQYTGWIGYCLSKNDRQFPTINNGKYFPYKYDRRHEISINCSYNFNKNKNISITWIYKSGNPITLATQAYPVISSNADGNVSFVEANDYTSINNYRLQAYHRLDIGYKRTKKVRNTERVLYLGLYNAYNRMNPYYVYFKEDSNGIRKLYKYTLFPIIPSISYSIIF